MTRQDPAISVVITCYNYAGFVGTAIRSVLDQEGATAELIVVDDASSDSSREVISGFGDQIKALFQEANGGHGAAFNAGYEASTGDIVMFLDADDFLLPGALARVVADFDPEVPMCQYRMNLVDGAGRAYDIFPKLEQPFLSGDQKPRLLRTGRVPTTVTSGLVFSRRFLEQVMPMPPEAFRQGADGYLATLAPLFGPLADGGPEPVAAYRQHGQNHSGFGAVIEKRALWCVQHDEARYDALRAQAARLQEVPAAALGWGDEGYLSQKMALVLRGLHPQPQPSRLRLSLAALRVMREQPASLINRVVVSLWWLGLAVLPVSLARHLHAWKLHAATRPAWLKWSARKLRRL